MVKGTDARMGSVDGTLMDKIVIQVQEHQAQVFLRNYNLTTPPECFQHENTKTKTDLAAKRGSVVAK